MAIFDPKSLRAEEFINDEEIRETIAYAEANKHNIELINSLLEKAAPKRSGNGVTCAGLTHREASVLLACDIPEVTERMYKLANDIKLAFLRKQNRNVRSALSFKLLRERLRILSVSPQKQTYRPY